MPPNQKLRSCYRLGPKPVVKVVAKTAFKEADRGFRQLAGTGKIRRWCIGRRTVIYGQSP